MPSIPRIFAPPASGGREASPQDFGVERTQGIGQVSRAVRELGDTAATLYEGDQTAKVGRAVSAATLELQDLQTRLAQDQNYETHAEVFEKSRDAILKRHGEGFNPRFQGEFRDRVTPLAGRIAIDVRTSVRAKQIDTAIANIDQNELDLGRLAAEAPDPAQRAGYRGEYAIQVRDLVRAGYLSAQDATNRLQRFEKTVATADSETAIQTDPLGALREMRDPASPLLQGLNAAEVAQRRTRALNELESQLAQQRAALGFQQAQEERAKRKAAEEAQKNADELLFSGKLGELNQYLVQNRGALDAADLRYYRDAIASGGPPVATKTDPGAYLNLSNAAAQGESVRDQVDALMRAERFTREDRDRIVKLSEDRRFSSSRDLIEGSTQQDMFDFSTDRQAKRAEALKAFDDDVAQHPEWTRVQADQHAREILRSYGFKDAIGKRKPSDPVGPTGQVDINAAVSQAAQRFGSDPEALKAELRRLRDLEAAQQLQGAK